MLEVCLDTKTMLRNCEKCRVEFRRVKRQRFCSNACRQAAYRERPAYLAIKNEGERARQKLKDEEFKSLNRYCSIGFDARYSGPLYGPDKRARRQKDRGDLLFGAPRCTTSKDAIEISSRSLARSATANRSKGEL
jgi:hypothetical protein